MYSVHNVAECGPLIPQCGVRLCVTRFHCAKIDDQVPVLGGDSLGPKAHCTLCWMGVLIPLRQGEERIFCLL